MKAFIGKNQSTFMLCNQRKMQFVFCRKSPDFEKGRVIYMEYQVRQIHRKEELAQCEVFHIDQYNWGGSYQPKTYGRMGLLKNREDEGFLIEMVCEESNPVRTYEKQNDPVYLDSAMEAFLCFGTKECQGLQEPCYMNFEMNANGAMLASIGCQRINRVNLSDEIRKQVLCTPAIHEDRWMLTLWIPLTVIDTLYCNDSSAESGNAGDSIPKESLHLGVGSTFTCNFFKLKESEGETQHFASFSPIDYPEPNFHLPEYFARAVIIEKDCKSDCHHKR